MLFSLGIFPTVDQTQVSTGRFYASSHCSSVKAGLLKCGRGGMEGEPSAPSALKMLHWYWRRRERHRQEWAGTQNQRSRFGILPYWLWRSCSPIHLILSLLRISVPNTLDFQNCKKKPYGFWPLIMNVSRIEIHPPNFWSCFYPLLSSFNIDSWDHAKRLFWTITSVRHKHFLVVLCESCWPLSSLGQVVMVACNLTDSWSGNK